LYADDSKMQKLPKNNFGSFYYDLDSLHVASSIGGGLQAICLGRYSEHEVNTALNRERRNLSQECIQCIIVSTADTQSGIYEQIGDIIVAGEHTANERIEVIISGYVVFINIHKSCGTGNHKSRYGTLLNADYTALGCFNCSVYCINESVGFAVTLRAYDDFYHVNLSFGKSLDLCFYRLNTIISISYGKNHLVLLFYTIMKQIAIP
jgi:hypothetical protein